ncbi:MAG: dihydrodipicolinate synthase family protein, partial [Gemmatimonadales bacterium]
RIAAVLRQHPSKLLITGEDRFLGYSLLLGARAALIGMGAALPDLQADLLRARAAEDWPRFIHLSDLCDRFAQTTFIDPLEGYIRRMLWAAAADGGLPPDACDDPWGPPLPADERETVERMVRDARATRA